MSSGLALLPVDGVPESELEPLTCRVMIALLGLTCTVLLFLHLLHLPFVSISSFPFKGRVLLFIRIVGLLAVYSYMFLFLHFFLSSSGCFQACSRHLCLTRSDSTVWCHTEECGRRVLPRLPPVLCLVGCDIVFLDTVNPPIHGRCSWFKGQHLWAAPLGTHPSLGFGSRRDLVGLEIKPRWPPHSVGILGILSLCLSPHFLSLSLSNLKISQSSFKGQLSFRESKQ